MTFDKTRIERRFATSEATVLEGVVGGYASAFDVLDSHKTKIAKGAFQASLVNWRSKKRPVPMYLNHSDDALIGWWEELTEDEYGLRVSGQIVTKEREYINELFRSNTLGGMSIGFYPLKWEGGEGHAYTFTEVELIEVSLVTAPSNAAAEIEHVRSLPHGTIRDFEKFLRDNGYSSGAAKSIAVNGYKGEHRDDAPLPVATEPQTTPDHREDAGNHKALLQGLKSQLLLMRLQNDSRRITK
jgi:HK97 family phage prohead protease